MMTSTKNILCVGLVCLDVIAVTNEYPTEDSDSRCVDQRWQRGGNAANNCTVLSHLRTRCELLATIGSNPELISYQFLKKDLQIHGIKWDHCRLYESHNNPMTMVIVNEHSGTRTILHHRGSLPELDLKDFAALDLSVYSWIHFEARNHTAYAKMMTLVNQWNFQHASSVHRISVSVEIEKLTPGFEPLVSLADVVFISKDLAQASGHGSKEEAAIAFAKQLKNGATVVCPWGQDGVAACTNEGVVMSETAFHPECVKDTLGAGDVFVAATIRALSDGKSMRAALNFGCRIAGKKCGFHGFEEIARVKVSNKQEDISKRVVQWSQCNPNHTRISDVAL